MEGYIIEISHVIIRKFHIYMPEDRPYEITVIMDMFDIAKGSIKVHRKMPDEELTFDDPIYIVIANRVRKELEK